MVNKSKLVLETDFQHFINFVTTTVTRKRHLSGNDLFIDNTRSKRCYFNVKFNEALRKHFDDTIRMTRTELGFPFISLPSCMKDVSRIVIILYFALFFLRNSVEHTTHLHTADLAIELSSVTKCVDLKPATLDAKEDCGTPCPIILCVILF